MTTSTATDAGTEYSLLDYLTIARKRWVWIAIPVVLLVAGSVYYSLSQPDRFRSSASVLLADTAAQRTLDPSSQNTGFLSRELSNEITLAESDAVESLVVGELGAEPDVDISAEADSDVLVFTATAGDAEEAALHANTWAEQYVEVKRDQAVASIAATSTSLRSRLADLRAERQNLREPLDDLDRRIARTADPAEAALLQGEYNRLADDLQYELELVTSQSEATQARITELDLQAELASVGEARSIQTAVAPEQTANRPLSSTVVLGTVLGLLLGAGLALLAEMRDNTIKSATDVSTVTDLPVLASIPKASRRARQTIATAAHLEPDGPLADAYHKVRSSLEFLSLEQEVCSVLVTSANPSEGKSTSSSNLALALASVGQRTVLLDLDFRRATLHQVYQVTQNPGVSDLVLYGADVSSVTYSFNEPGLDKLILMPTGTVPPNPAAFVGTADFLKTVDWIESQADVVVMDAPPLLAVSDAHTLSKHVDAVLVTARAGETTRRELAEVLMVLKQVGARVAGVILIGVDEAEKVGRYGEYYQKPERVVSGQPSQTDLWDVSNAVNTIDIRDGVKVGTK